MQERFQRSQRGFSGATAAVLATVIGGLAVVGLRLGNAPATPFGSALRSDAATFVIPAGAHAAGAAGTNWRTDVEIHNASATQVSYTVALLRRDQDNASPATKSYTLAPGMAARYPDAVWGLFSFSGAAALRINAGGGPLVISSRTYNLLAAGNPLGLPAGSTFGQLVPGSVLDEAIPYGSGGRLLQLTHAPSPSSGATTGFRTNIGAVNAGSAPIEVVVELYAAAGAKLGELRRTLRAWEYVQWDRVFEQVTAGAVSEGYAIVRTTTAGGALFAYASVVDNATGDPIYIPAAAVSVAAGPTPSPSASPSPSATAPPPTAPPPTAPPPTAPPPTAPPPTPTVPPGAATLQPGPGANNGSDQGGASAGKDTTIYKGGPSTNYGADPSFFIDDNEGTGCYNDNSTANGLLRFDVSSLPATASSAKLRLYCLRALPSTLGSVPVDLFRLDSDWNEMTATYGDRPVRGPLVTTVDVYDEPAGIGWYEWDVTALYNQWRSGAVANHGVEIHGFTCKANASHDRHFATSDHTDNPVVRPMLVVVPGSPAPTVNADLAPYKPSTWENPVVPDSQAGTRSTSVLSSYVNTYVDWAVANYGPESIVSRIDFELRLDGQRLTGWYAEGLQAGYYVSVDDAIIPYDTIPPGFHTLSIVADSESAVGETNESNNEWGKNWEWTTIVFAPPDEGVAAEPSGAWADRVRLEPRRMQDVEPGARAQAVSTSPIFVPASAHASGAGGTNWRTDLELHNPGTSTATCTMSLLKRDSDNSSPTTKSYTVQAGRSVRLNDLLASEFGFTGAAALRITPSSGTLLVTSRTYNLLAAGNSLGLPAGSTFGQFVPGLEEGAALEYGEEGRIVLLTHAGGSAAGTYRTNLGAVNATGASCAVVVELYDASGWRYGEVTKTLRPYEYVQWDRIYERVTGAPVSDGFAIVHTTTSGGRFFAYASVVDNATGDPIFVPAVKVVGGAPPPTPTATVPPTPGGGGVIAGPGGTTVTLPTETSPTTPVTLTSGDGADLAKDGETLVSTVIRVNVGGEGVARGSGPFVVQLPVTGAVSDPEKVQLKVQTNVGPVYPVAGVYDPVSKLFTAELQGLWDGWNLAVAVNPAVQVLEPSADSVEDASAQGWVTPLEWQTCAWRIRNMASRSTIAYRTEVQQALGAACDHLRNAGFRSPKLWIASYLNPPRRIAHVVQGTGPTDPTTSFRTTTAEDDAAFSIVGLNDAQMQDLGQLYFNWDSYQAFNVPHGIEVKQTVIHELFHAVQGGYDIRGKHWKSKDVDNNDVSNDSRLWFIEGTAVVVGMTFQTNLNGLYGGDVTVRPFERPENLSQVLQYWSGWDAYSRQDFFAYFAKRYNGGSFLDLDGLFQDMADVTDGQFGKTDEEYRLLYRRAMDIHYGQAFGVSLPEVYAEFAVDRAYRHTDAAIVRAADAALAKSSLDRTLFVAVTDWNPTTTPSATEQTVGHYSGLKPLQTWAVSAVVPDVAKQAGSFPISITVAGASLSSEEVRIFTFREHGGVMQTGGEFEVTDISGTVNVPVNSATETLTILVVNGSVENRPANVTLTWQPVTVEIAPRTVALQPGGTQQFTATVTGTTNTTVTWSVKESPAGGSITSGGLYTAPGTAGTYHVVATSQADPTASDEVTVTVSTAGGISLTISPTTANVRVNHLQEFTATLSGLQSGQVPYLMWEVLEGATGGTMACSSYCSNTTGRYTASRWPGTYHVVVKSQADPTRSATATVNSFASYEGGKVIFQFKPPGLDYAERISVGCNDASGLSGSTFTCQSDVSTPTFNERNVDSLTIALDPTLDHVVSFAADHKKYALDTGALEEHHAITGTGIPWVAIGLPDSAIFEINGTDACPHVTSFTFVEGGLNLNTYTCSEGSWLRAELHHFE